MNLVYNEGSPSGLSFFVLEKGGSDDLKKKVLKPNSEPQRSFLSSPAKICLYGGVMLLP